MWNADHQRFEHLLGEHAGIVRKIAGMYAAVPEDRHDLEQDICVQAWRSFRRFDKARAKFSTWLYRVALNVAISQSRRGRAKRAAPHESLDAHHLETISAAPAPERDERIDAMYACIQQLAPLDRALVLLHLEDRGYAEIAGVLGISETNVATKLSRVRHKLRERITEQPTTAGMRARTWNSMK